MNFHFNVPRLFNEDVHVRAFLIHKYVFSKTNSNKALDIYFRYLIMIRKILILVKETQNFDPNLQNESPRKMLDLWYFIFNYKYE